MTTQPRDEIRIRNQAIRACTLCDPAGYLPSGHLCHHNPAQEQSPERAAAKARSAAAVAEAQRKAKRHPDDQLTHEPCPHCGGDHTPATCPQPRVPVTDNGVTT